MTKEFYAIFITTLVNLQNENTLLKKELESRKIQSVSLKVTNRIDEWLNRPYQEKSERHDIERFAEEITKYIHDEMKN